MVSALVLISSQGEGGVAMLVAKESKNNVAVFGDNRKTIRIYKMNSCQFLCGLEKYLFQLRGLKKLK